MRDDPQNTMLQSQVVPMGPENRQKMGLQAITRPWFDLEREFLDGGMVWVPRLPGDTVAGLLLPIKHDTSGVCLVAGIVPKTSATHT